MVVDKDRRLWVDRRADGLVIEGEGAALAIVRVVEPVPAAIGILRAAPLIAGHIAESERGQRQGGGVLTTGNPRNTG